ncbi:hypothetical protein [Caulobacter sp. 17J65-9]|uniref:hypothetical protein n=1 Tax=Caulobacter sp. 17J65-9 TaxID=2709382 RepID=UPI0013C5E35E|nr:hypothetical protein [Caulobacter sp. 17J65-9]NEX94123.1 hypothetical protein [Caulobacter sp. 17J65-9]
MSRHACAAALACIVLGLPAPALAAGAEWWEVINESDGGGTMVVLADAASARTVSPGVIETRFMNQVAVDGTTLGWVDARIQHDCAQGRMRVAHGVVYDGQLKLVKRDDAGTEWAPLQAQDPTNLFVCKRERAQFQKRATFKPPVG